MPTLSEQQRQWLDQAINSKGRFTRARTVQKEFEKYQRRRAKTATFLEGVPGNAPNRPLIENGLKAADQLAEQGKFADAYKRLDGLKGMAKAANVDGGLATIANSDLNGRAAVIGVHLNTIVSTTDFAMNHFARLIQQVNGLKTCDEQPDFEAALDRRKELVGEEVNLRSELANRQNWIQRAIGEINTHKPLAAIEEAEEQIRQYTAAGLGGDIANNVQRIAGLKAQVLANGDRYHKTSVLRDYAKTMLGQFESRMRALTSLSRYQDRDGKGSTDPQAINVQKGLEGTANLEWIEDDAREQVESAQRLMQTAGIVDRKRFEDTARGPLALAPEPVPFDPSAVFDDLLDDELPVDLPFDKADELVKKARTRMDQVVKSLDPQGDEMFDLMLKTPEELAQMCSLSLTGVDSTNGFSQSHAACFRKMAEELKKSVLANCPNKMAPDAKKISVGGVDYDLQETLGEGGFGAARRFRDPVTGKSVVVKSLKGAASPEKREAMAGEMRTHRRALNGDENDVGADNIVEMQGAAVSDDGSLHMIMEDAEGGDLSQVANNMTMLVDSGFMTPEARNVLAIDMLAQTVKGMKAMENRGLVHNDMKPQNMLLTRDGKVKIIDFGESRFGDDQGKAPSARIDGFGTTAGFSAPETETQDTVDSKADTFALGGIAKAMLRMDGQLAEGVDSRPKDVSALGRLANALTDPDPTKRPSLDSVLMSTLIEDQKNSYAPEDVEDLRAAAAEVNMGLSATRSTTTRAEFDTNDYGSKIDSGWMPFYSKLKAGEDQDIPISLLQNMAAAGEIELNQQRDKLAKATTGDEQKKIRDKIAEIEQKQKFWADKADQAIKQTRDAGKQQMDNLLKNTTDKIRVPGLGGGDFTIADAIGKRETLENEIRELQNIFYELSANDPETALANMDPTNERLTEMAGQIDAINTGIKTLLGPEGRFYLAEIKLREVSARFGPARNAPRGETREAKDELADEDIDMDQIFNKDDVADEIEKRAQG